MKKKLPIIALLILVFLLSLSLTLYPAISSYYNEQHQSEIHTAYVEKIELADDSALIAAKQFALSYNESIIPGTIEAYSQDALVTASKDYDNQLNLSGDGIMGYIEIPSIDVYLPIYHGTGNDSLERGVGHLLGSSLPVGGNSTHTILTGHSGMASQKMFTDITQLQNGDVFYLHVLDETLAYRVCHLHTVLPHDTTYLGIRLGQDLCTLVTCTPVGINTHRLLVQGSRIPYEEAEVIQEQNDIEQAPVSTWEQQYLQGLLLGLGAVAVITVLILVAKKVRHG